MAEGAPHGWPVGDAMLVASELVTNAVRHSGGGAGDLVEVEVDFNGELVRLRISDPGMSGSRVEMRRAGIAFGGLGLRLVEQLTSRWGSERRPDGRQLVWAEVPAGEGLMPLA
ncbi:MAG TPA: ATP-binding protein [Candidatus Limnocylindria bacterium]|nr:ATP-binding protein [Candidatus Limnocylindria bacterium]